MPWLDDRWMSDAFRALKAAFDVDSRTRNLMIQFLREEGFWDQAMSWDSAVAKWNSCLNPNKSEFFKIGEVWALCCRFDRHQLLEAMAASMGRELRTIPTEERRQVLLERIARATESCESEIAAARAALQRLEEPTPVAGAGLAPGAPPRFSVPATAVERIGCP